MAEEIATHSFSRQGCPVCGNECLHSQYSRQFVRFVRAHWEAYEAAFLDGNAQASRNELERLEREYKTLPPRHDCSCYGHHCMECARIARQRVDAPTRVEIGRTRPVHAPMPSVLLMDINSGYAA